jgi:hypothetical protein
LRTRVALHKKMSNPVHKDNPLGEVFGFPVCNEDRQASRYREQKLCPYNNKVPNCTKDKANNPLGVCSVNTESQPVITCPVRFREDWLIVTEAAKFFFPAGTRYTSLTEIRLLDANRQSAGNIDVVLVSYDDRGKLVDFGSLEIQGVYISGNLRTAFEAYTERPDQNFTWRGSAQYYPRPDYLSSSRKRLIPQMLYKGGIFHHWGKKQSVALQTTFFDTLPKMPEVTADKAEVAWFLYDLIFDQQLNRFRLTHSRTVYTEFREALHTVTNPRPGKVEHFVGLLQGRLDAALEGGNTNNPDAPTLGDILSNEP